MLQGSLFRQRCEADPGSPPLLCCVSQEATPKEVLHALMTVPSLYSSIDEGGHVTSGFPPALSGIYNMIANLPRTGGAAEDAGTPPGPSCCMPLDLGPLGCLWRT